MKKLLTVLALTLMTMVIALTVAGCGTDTSAVDNLTDKVDELTARIEDLEKENEDLTNQLKNQFKNLNVFWTDKKEYSETETMTIYFRNTAVYKIRLRFNTTSGTPFISGGGNILNGYCYITSLCSDIYSSEIIGASFLEWDKGFSVLSPNYNPSLIKKGVETESGGAYYTTTDYSGMTWLDFVICVPGTHVELARFKNVTVTK